MLIHFAANEHYNVLKRDCFFGLLLFFCQQDLYISDQAIDI
jgi:hypothetical protein